MNRYSFTLMAGLIVVTGCHRQQSGTGSEPSLPVAAVRVETVASRKRVATEEVVGTVRPKLSASLSARQISGTIVQMLAVPGQSVKSRQLLVEIDAREIQARVEQAAALRDQTQKDIDRFKKLLADNALTQQEFDAAQSRYRVAQASLREAETMLGYTKITAPFDGLITAKRADVGDLASPGRPLLEMEDPSALRLEADVPEALTEKIKLGDKLAVRVPAAKLSVDGIVSEVSPAADPISRTSRVKLDLPSAPGLRSGQFGRVAVPLAEVSAIAVPDQAVVVRGQMEIAFVVANQRAQMRLIKTGKRLGNEIEVVSGLNPGEQMVIDGASQLQDGQPLEIKK